MIINAVGISLSFFVETKLRDGTRDVIVIGICRDKRVKPAELPKKLTSIHVSSKTIQTYLWVTRKKKCCEARGLKKNDQILLANDAYRNTKRDFSEYLNNWNEIIKLNRNR